MILDPESFVECKGRDFTGQEVLKVSLHVRIKITRPNESTIWIRPEGCPHYQDADGRDFCSASGPRAKKPGTSVRAHCPFAVSLPGTVDVLWHHLRNLESPF